MTMHADGYGTERRMFNYGGLSYVGRAITVGELAELAREVARDKFRSILAHAVARGILAIV